MFTLRLPKSYPNLFPVFVIVALTAIIGISHGSASPTDPLGDINSDSVVDAYDLSLFVRNYGSHVSGAASGDLDNNGVVDGADAQLLQAHFRQKSTGTNTAGRINFVLRTGPSYDPYTSSTSTSTRQWINNHLWRMEVFTTYFDDKTSWYPSGWVYKDSYSIGTGSALASQHPEWALKDQAGNKLYIPWGCSNGTCPQYAADFGNPSYRQNWINEAKTALAKGYKGLWVDDVNMDWRVGDGNGNFVTPYDSRTGAPMTYDNWKRYMAEFMEQIRSQIPGAEILHNSIWYAGGPTRDADAYVQREAKAADYINREGGFNDGGLTGGTGIWSVQAVMDYIDRVHALGKHIIIDSFTDNAADREYGLAGYFLINNGGDGYGNSDVNTPDNWWSGYDVNLGAATGGRYQWNGLWRRDFSGGMVLLNEPGSASKTASLGGTFKTLDGSSVTSLTLGTAHGAILRR